VTRKTPYVLHWFVELLLFDQLLFFCMLEWARLLIVEIQSSVVSVSVCLALCWALFLCCFFPSSVAMGALQRLFVAFE